MAEGRAHRDRAGQVDAAGPLASARVESDRGERAIAENRLDEAAHLRSGADFDEGADSRGIHGFDAGDELDRVRELVSEKVGDRCDVGGVGRARRVRENGDCRRLEGDPGNGRSERNGGVRHERAVERTGDLEHGRPNLAGLENLGGAPDLGCRAAQHHLGRGVLIGDDQIELLVGDHLRRIGGRKRDGDHAAAVARACRHQLAARAGQPEQGLFAIRAGGAQGGQFAERVADQAGRPDAELLEGPERADRDGADRGLGDARIAQGVFLDFFRPLVERDGRVGQLSETLSVGQLAERRIGLRDRVERLGNQAAQVAAHVDILGALAREDDAERRDTRSRLIPRAVGQREPLGKRRGGELRICRGGQGRYICFPGFDDEHEPARMGGLEIPPRLRGEFPQFGRFERRLEGGEGCSDGRRRAAGQCHDLGAAVPVDHALRLVVFLDQDVVVAAAEPERADRGPARILRRGEPGPLLEKQVKRTFRILEDRSRLLHLDRGRKGLVVQRHRGLDEAGRAGGGLRVTDHRFDRADAASGTPVDGIAVHAPDRLQFDLVADLGAGAVGLDEADRLGAEPRVLVCSSQSLFLAGVTRRVDRLAAPVARRADAPYECVNLVAVGLRLVETLENHHADALAEGGPVGVGAERPRVARRRERRSLAEAHIHEDIVEHIDAAGDHHVGVPGVQLHRGHVEGAERASARGIDDAVRAAEIQAVCDAAGRDVPEQAGERVLLPRNIRLADVRHDLVGDFVGDTGIFESLAPDRVPKPGTERDDELKGAGQAENDADTVAVEFPLRAVPRVDHRALCDHEAHQLRGIGRLESRRGNAELDRIEHDRGNEAAPLRIRAVWLLRILVVVVFRAPVGGGNVGDGIHLVADVRPVFAQRLRPGEQTAHSNDGQWFVHRFVAFHNPRLSCSADSRRWLESRRGNRKKHRRARIATDDPPQTCSRKGTDARRRGRSPFRDRGILSRLRLFDEGKSQLKLVPPRRHERQRTTVTQSRRGFPRHISMRSAPTPDLMISSCLGGFVVDLPVIRLILDGRAGWPDQSDHWMRSMVKP